MSSEKEKLFTSFTINPEAFRADLIRYDEHFRVYRQEDIAELVYEYCTPINADIVMCLLLGSSIAQISRSYDRSRENIISVISFAAQSVGTRQYQQGKVPSSESGAFAASYA